jgi:hypothetical protein
MQSYTRFLATILSGSRLEFAGIVAFLPLAHIIVPIILSGFLVNLLQEEGRREQGGKEEEFLQNVEFQKVLVYLSFK